MQKQSFNLILTALLFFAAGFIVSGLTASEPQPEKPTPQDPAMQQDHGHVMNDSMPHSHSAMKHEPVIAESPLPTVDLSVQKDPVSGWNLQIATQNFVFAPSKAGLEHKSGEGHAHLYINGEKITRLYGEWYHFPSLEPGMHEIRVTLNSNDHGDLVTPDGDPIEDTVMLTVQ